MTFEEITKAAKARYNRLAQHKLRGGKTSYVTQIEDLKILLAWQAGDLSEGQATKLLGVGRIEARTMMDDALVEAGHLCNALNELASRKKCAHRRMVRGRAEAQP